ncbi:MAG: hypothetical protein H0W70_05345 [Actinobacteria bacterium]|nr:hypothetical protein [Actinomycetota bacterium]
MARPTAILRWSVVGALLVGLLIDAALTVNRHFEYVAGGDCGGKSCINDRHDKGIRIGLAFLLAAVAIAAWPRLVRRYGDVRHEE